MPTASEKPSTIKRRACDECRHRKLACSKDASGCERCTREKLVCQYSEQKPMGRPRKRKHVENAEDEVLLNDHNDPLDPGFMKLSAEDLDFDAALARPYGTTVTSDALFQEDILELRTTQTDEDRVVWHFGDSEILAGPPVNFEELVMPDESSLPAVGPVSQTFIASNSENAAPVTTAPLASCSCLASMYLSLASLQHFPTDVLSALSTVRKAASTAAASLWCPQCGTVVMDTVEPPIESFQNMMLLGTILPIIAHGYGRLLRMVDVETDEAVAAGRTKTFTYKDFGGMCPKRLSPQQAMICMEKELFFNAMEMPPAQWRTTVRALLRVDIYGHEEESGFKHKGLKDLVNDIEYRQRTRHEMIDEQLANGMLDPTKLGHGFGHSTDIDKSSHCVPGDKTRGCLEILKLAQRAIDGLVIA